MQNYRKTSHTTYDCKYHIVWITKYRKRILGGVIAESVRDLIRGICKEHEVEILKGHISQDHVHLFVSVPPHLSISKLVQYLKGKSSYKMLQEHKPLSKLFWGRHLWGRGYFVATSGNVTDEVIMDYIKNQDDGETEDDFTITGG
jgi:putative transposase